MTADEQAVVDWCLREGVDPALWRLCVEQAHQVVGIGPRSDAFPHPGYRVDQPLRQPPKA